mmetsp:Transcript_74728/g.215918  ORF Transcript_74728/g.215918 Transcript_74728/m.215918 type:complete len:379 (-) Transcript_74728:259-1395(-)
MVSKAAVLAYAADCAGAPPAGPAPSADASRSEPPDILDGAVSTLIAGLRCRGQRGCSLGALLTRLLPPFLRRPPARVLLTDNICAAWAPTLSRGRLGGEDGGCYLWAAVCGKRMFAMSADGIAAPLKAAFIEEVETRSSLNGALAPLVAAFSPGGGGLLALGYDDGHLLVRKVDDGGGQGCNRSVDIACSARIESVAFTQDACSLAAACSDGSVVVVDAECGCLQRKVHFAWHSMRIAFLDHQTLVVGALLPDNRAGVLKVQVATGQLLVSRPLGLASWVGTLTCSPDLRTVACVLFYDTERSAVVVVDAHSLDKVYRWEPAAHRAITSAAYAPDASAIMLGLSCGRVTVLATRSGRPMFEVDFGGRIDIVVSMRAPL